MVHKLLLPYKKEISKIVIINHNKVISSQLVFKKISEFHFAKSFLIHCAFPLFSTNGSNWFCGGWPQGVVGQPEDEGQGGSGEGGGCCGGG